MIQMSQYKGQSTVCSLFFYLLSFCFFCVFSFLLPEINIEKFQKRQEAIVNETVHEKAKERNTGKEHIVD